MYRSDKWNNPYKFGTLGELGLGSAFESGADEMLKDLIVRGQYLDPQGMTFNTVFTDGKTKGWLVFIPDESSRLDN